MYEQKLPLLPGVILAFLAIILFWESPQPRPHDISAKDREVIQKAREVLINQLNLEWIRFEFSSEKEERYTLCCYPKGFLGPLEVSLKGLEDNKELKAVSKQIVQIFNQISKQMGFEAEVEKVNNLEWKLVLPRYFPEQLGKIVEELARYFRNLFVDWKGMVPESNKFRALFILRNINK
jgi:hypothetical protein